MTENSFDSERILRYFKGKHSDKDAAYIEKVFCDDEKEPELKSHLSVQFDELLSENGKESKNLDHILYKIHYEINTRLPAQQAGTLDKIIKWSLRLAAIIIIPVAIFIGIQMNKEANSKKDAWVEINAPAWTRVQFRLPDGTIGWLNSNSSVKYNGNFTSDRQVTIKGEAFFDVFKDKKRPFWVTANEITVKVLGTRFNIAAYENEHNIEVVLQEGKVLFNSKEMKKSYTMKPNDIVIYNKTLHNISIDVVKPEKYLAWTEGKLVFRNDPLDVVARRLARWYNIDVDVKVSLTEDLRLRATFIDENLEDVLDLLKRTLPIDYRIESQSLNQDQTFAKKKVILFSRIK